MLIWGFKFLYHNCFGMFSLSLTRFTHLDHSGIKTLNTSISSLLTAKSQNLIISFMYLRKYSKVETPGLLLRTLQCVISKRKSDQKKGLYFYLKEHIFSFQNDSSRYEDHPNIMILFDHLSLIFISSLLLSLDGSLFDLLVTFARCSPMGMIADENVLKKTPAIQLSLVFITEKTILRLA